MSFEGKKLSRQGHSERAHIPSSVLNQGRKSHSNPVKNIQKVPLRKAVTWFLCSTPLKRNRTPSELDLQKKWNMTCKGSFTGLQCPPPGHGRVVLSWLLLLQLTPQWQTQGEKIRSGLWASLCKVEEQMRWSRDNFISEMTQRSIEISKPTRKSAGKMCRMCTSMPWAFFFFF